MKIRTFLLSSVVVTASMAMSCDTPGTSQTANVRNAQPTISSPVTAIPPTPPASSMDIPDENRLTRLGSDVDVPKSDTGGAKPGSTTRKNIAMPGFYLEIWTCNVCAANSPDRKEESAFNKKGYEAFYGKAEYREDSQTIRFIEKYKRNSPDYPTGPFPSSLFVGPFRSEVEAQVVLDQIPSILSRQIRKANRYATREPVPVRGDYNVEIKKVG